MILTLVLAQQNEETIAAIYNPVTKIMSCLFLAIFVIMGLVNAALFRQVRKHSQLLEADADIFSKEQAALITVFVLFELSYLSRFIFDLVADEDRIAVEPSFVLLCYE